MRLLARVCAGLALGLLLLSSPVRADQSACDPAFPLKDGWLGGDGVYSVPLDAQRSLWLFGDSFIGAPEARDRHNAAFVSNSAAISTCRDGTWTIAYHWRSTAEGPADLFQSAVPGIRYWPLDGLMHDGRLIVFLMRVETRDAGHALGFAVTGTDLAVIANPFAPPASWRMQIHSLAPERPALAGAALWAAGAHHVVLAAPLEAEGPRKHAVALARLPFAALDAPAAALQWRDHQGQWHNALSLSATGTVIPRASSEMSLDRLRRRHWLAVHMDPTPFFLNIVHRTAPTLTGPWSPPRLLYTIPKPAGPKPAGESIFCYAGKAHAQFARDDTLLLTYACNSFNPDDLMADLGLYRPHAVRVPAP